MIEGDPVPLGAAPALMFPEQWARLVALKGSEDKARATLGRSNDGMLAHYRNENLRLNQLTAEVRARELAEEEADALADKLCADFIAFATDGRIVAAGLFTGTGLRQPIPAELWLAANIEFAAGRFTSNGLTYLNVRVDRDSLQPESEGGPTAMTAWLGERRKNRGDETKKVLQAAAHERFGKAFTVRTFNKAYSAAYGRSRGRPAK